MCGEQVSGSPPLLLQWVKTEHALVMLFNNGTLQVWKKLMNSTIYLVNKWCNAVMKQANCISFTWHQITARLLHSLPVFLPLQVNFYTDHTKIILCKSLDDSYLLTYISRERVSYTYLLSMLTELGCTSELRHRLRYVVQLLQHHADA